MLIDLIIVAAAIGAAVWGYHAGFGAGGLALFGFGAGVVLGSRLTPLVLDEGLRDPYAPIIALPGALILGAIFAAILERFALGVRRRIVRKPLLDGAAGAAVAACLALVVVWAVGAAAARVDDLRDDVRDSSVIDRLNAVVPPAGPLLRAHTEPDSLPEVAGPSAGVRAGNPIIKRDPQVREAAGSVVKVTAVACEHQGGGSGWVARDGGIVVTNAHVVKGSEDMRVQRRGVGPPHEANAIFFDERRDIAVLHAPALAGTPALPIAQTARRGTVAAVLGFPGGAYSVRPARVGGTAKVPGRRVAKELVKRKVTSLRAIVRAGNSGGPVVDGGGRVVAVIFAGQAPENRRGGHTAYGVPVADVRRALARARGPVDTGGCEDE